ncbi:MAG: hypothetical protein RH862_20315 [Leptospiraceae bacterium]
MDLEDYAGKMEQLMGLLEELEEEAERESENGRQAERSKGVLEVARSLLGLE